MIRKKLNNKMGLKVTLEDTKALNLRDLPLSLHWKIEKYAKAKKLGKEKAAEKILTDALRNIKLLEA